MAIYRIDDGNLEKIEETTFASEGIKERQDLQRMLRDSIDIIAPDLMVIAEEFCEWTDSQRRIDLLAIDSAANIVVIELKRTQDGGHMDLQAIRYAAMVSNMTFARASEICAEFRSQPVPESEQTILDFLGWDTPDEGDFGVDVRLILASAEFSRELTTSVLWLNERGLDIQCIRIKPYKRGQEVLINVEQVIPLPEAEEFQVKVREKKAKQRAAQKSSDRDFMKRDLKVNGQFFSGLPKRRIMFEVVKAAVDQGAEVEDIVEIMPNSKWLVLEGTHEGADLSVGKIRGKSANGREINPRRYYVSDEDLFFSNGKTYVLSNQWGKGTQRFVEKLTEAFALEVEVEW